ncbi:hypothetical protein D3C79_1021420 [compost metagenome]
MPKCPTSHAECSIQRLYEGHVRLDFVFREAAALCQPALPDGLVQRRAAIALIERQQFQAAFQFGRSREIDDDGAVQHLVGKRLGGFILVHRSSPQHIPAQR